MPTPAKTAATVFHYIFLPLAIVVNLIGNEKPGLSTVLLNSADANVVQPSGRSGVPASNTPKHLYRMLLVKGVLPNYLLHRRPQRTLRKSGKTGGNGSNRGKR
jgi:hypothetical protein